MTYFFAWRRRSAENETDAYQKTVRMEVGNTLANVLVRPWRIEIVGNSVSKIVEEMLLKLLKKFVC
jgi:hypothetical protein